MIKITKNMVPYSDNSHIILDFLIIQNINQIKLITILKCQINQQLLMKIIKIIPPEKSQLMQMYKLQNIYLNSLLQSYKIKLSQQHMKIFIINTVVLYLVVCLHLQNTEEQTIAIISTNDIHGSAIPTKLVRFDTNQTYTYGGLTYMAHMIKTVKKQFEGNVLYLDAGDQFQGAIQSSSVVSSGKIINQFLNQLKVDASAIGNHQFDFGPQFLLNFLNHRVNSSLQQAANLVNQKNQTNFLPLQQPSKIFTLKNDLKIGVIGLITKQTLTTTTGFTNHLFPDYKFLDYAPIVISESKKLKQQGANAVILLGHLGNFCFTSPTYGHWYESTKQTQFCNENDEIGTLIKTLPNGTIDAVVQGHRHVFAHHYINGIPYMGSINGDYYFNVMYLTFKNKKIINKVIQGPIPVCEKIFNNTKRCNYHNQTQLLTAGPLTNWLFHGQLVQQDKQLSQKYNKQWIPLMKSYLQFICFNKVLLQRLQYQEHQLGNFLTTLMRQSYPVTDFSVINVGSQRTTWSPGQILVQDIYNMFPFNNSYFTTFQINGTSLIKLMSVLQISTHGFFPFQGLKISLKKYKNGTTEFIGIKLANGSSIEPSRIYKGVSYAAALNGLDDFATYLKQGFTFDNKINQGQVKQVVKTYLIKLQIIKPGYYDPKNPRLLITNV